MNPDPTYMLDTYLLERDADMDKERYLVVGGLRQVLIQELRQVRLLTAINKSGTVFLWPVKLAGDGTRISVASPTQPCSPPSKPRRFGCGCGGTGTSVRMRWRVPRAIWALPSGRISYSAT